MQMRNKSLLSVALALLAMTWVGSVPAQRVESGHTVPFGVPLAPPIYFVNFIFLYFANPATAALMPAYRVPIPELVYRCLLQNPDGCPYDKVARFFQRQANDRVSRGGDTVYPHYCQTTPRWQSLAPPIYQDPEQINEPLGPDKAFQLAQALGIDHSMILSPAEYSCVMGVPPRTPDQEILYACFIDFTASKGNGVVVPFSSYGLNLNEQGNVLSLCAPHAPCLEANRVFQQLNAIAATCGFTNKLDQLVRQTPVLQFIAEGHECQTNTAPACIAPTTRSDR
jgi:hypothetical protein